MIARWGATCAKCGTTIAKGDQMKPQWKKDGFDPDTGKPRWVRVPKAYVHAPKCPKVTPNKPGQRKIDYVTGEVLDGPVLEEGQLQLGG